MTQAPPHSGLTGVTLLAESLFAMLPGTDLVPAPLLDSPRPTEPEIIAALKAALTNFREAGGRRIVDLAGLTMGRNVVLNELLASITGVEILTASGFGPSWSVGSHYFNNVSEAGMTVDRLADIFVGEATMGALIPNRGRAARTPLIVLVPERGGFQLPEGAEEFRHFLQSEQSFLDLLIAAHARAAKIAEVPLYVKLGDDPLVVLEKIEREGLPASQVVLGGLDRRDHAAAGLAITLAAQGHPVVLDHVGWPEGWLDAAEQSALVLELFAQGLGDRIAVSSSAVGVSVEVGAPIIGDFTRVFTEFIPAFRAAGGTDEQLTQITGTNPMRFLGLEA